jgi:hypothetical protein
VFNGSRLPGRWRRLFRQACEIPATSLPRNSVRRTGIRSKKRGRAWIALIQTRAWQMGTNPSGSSSSSTTRDVTMILNEVPQSGATLMSKRALDGLNRLPAAPLDGLQLVNFSSQKENVWGDALASNIVDGNPTSAWVSRDGQFPQTIILALPRSAAISEVSFDNPAYGDPNRGAKGPRPE